MEHLLPREHLLPPTMSGSEQRSVRGTGYQIGLNEIILLQNLFEGSPTISHNYYRCQNLSLLLAPSFRRLLVSEKYTCPTPYVRYGYYIAITSSNQNPPERIIRDPDYLFNQYFLRRCDTDLRSVHAGGNVNIQAREKKPPSRGVRTSPPCAPCSRLHRPYNGPGCPCQAFAHFSDCCDDPVMSIIIHYSYWLCRHWKMSQKPRSEIFFKLRACA